MSDGQAAKISPKNRLLKILLESEHGCQFESREEMITLIGVHRKIRFPKVMVDHCVEHGHVSMSKRHLKISDSGIAWLAKASGKMDGAKNAAQNYVEKVINFDGKPHTVLKNQNESPLTRLFHRKGRDGLSYINVDHLSAGERLRRDFERANMQPKVSATLDASVSRRSRGGASNGAVDISDLALDKRNAVYDALDQLGPDLAGVCLDVCCFLKGLETVERERHWPPRSAKLMLRTALGILARFYGVTKTPRRPSNRKHVYAAHNFKPSMFAEGR